MSAPFLNFFSALLAGFLLSPFSLHAAPAEESVPPSVGEVVGSPRVVRGGVCEVIVRGIVMPRDAAEFKIHKGPKHGSLDGPVLQGKDTVAYTYRHNGKKGVDSDRIDFRIKTGPNNTWGPVTAIIAIEEPPSRVELIESQLDFGSVPIGQTRSAFLNLRNGGGGFLVGTLETGAPWSIDGPAEFELAEGKARDIRVVFSPDGPGERKGRLDVVVGNDRHPVDLRGGGVYRFEAPERISPAGGAPIKIPLTNLTDVELPLSIVIPAPLLGESMVVLPATAAGTLDLELEKRHYTEKMVDVTLSDGTAARKVQVALPPPPALLEWASEGGKVDLGEVPLRHVPRPEFELRNRGANGAAVELRTSGDGLALASGQPEKFDLGPGESSVVKTLWRLPGRSGPFSARLIASDGGLEHPLALEVLVGEAPPSEEKPAIDLPAAAVAKRPSPTFRKLDETEQKELICRLPSDITYRLIPEGRSAAARVSWKYRGPEPVLFLLEKKVVERSKAPLEETFDRRLRVPGELPEPTILEKWVPGSSPEAQPRRLGDGSWEGLVQGLAPGFHELRLGVRSPPDAPRIDSDFAVRVGRVPPNPLWKWVAGSIGIFCLLYLMRKKIRRLLGRKSDEP